MALRKRLLQDIAELQSDPYPNIFMCTHEDLIHQACLILTPLGKEPLHLTIEFGEDYPLKAPKVTIQTWIEHPNVFGDYICASILNTTEGYTPAYTLKSIALQLLSFFSSDSIEQIGGGYSIRLDEYRQNSSRSSRYGTKNSFECIKCGFGGKQTVYPGMVRVGFKLIPDPFQHQRQSVKPTDSGQIYSANGQSEMQLDKPSDDFGGYFRSSSFSPVFSDELHNHDFTTSRWVAKPKPAHGENVEPLSKRIKLIMKPTIAAASRDQYGPDNEIKARPQKQPHLIDLMLALPDELFVLILEELDTRDLVAVAKVEPRIGEFMNSYDTIRMRELQCFCFKKSFLDAKLGVGVHVSRQRKPGTFESEFDLLSQAAFGQFQVRQSIQGLRFEHWLPLPLSHRHWRSVSATVRSSLANLAKAADINDSRNCNIEVIYSFMNNIVVKLSEEAEKSWVDIKSTLTHASEKAIESYFSIFHLLLCLATENQEIFRDVNRRLQRFLAGHTSKDACPNLGFLLVAALISDQGLSQDLTFAIIREAIVRNVVWMLDKKGKGMAELSYMEPSTTSEYRLRYTFEASRTSYRILMFQALFSRNARTDPNTSISTIRDELFDRHGAPPKGAATTMAAEVRNIRSVNSWLQFFKVMGIDNMPSDEDFCAFLKSSIGESVKKGYSVQALTQGQALAVRKAKEPTVEVAQGVTLNHRVPSVSFFPGKQGKGRGGR